MRAVKLGPDVSRSRYGLRRQTSLRKARSDDELDFKLKRSRCARAAASCKYLPCGAVSSGDRICRRAPFWKRAGTADGLRQHSQRAPASPAAQLVGSAAAEAIRQPAPIRARRVARQASVFRWRWRRARKPSDHQDAPYVCTPFVSHSNQPPPPSGRGRRLPAASCWPPLCSLPRLALALACRWERRRHGQARKLDERRASVCQNRSWDRRRPARRPPNTRQIRLSARCVAWHGLPGGGTPSAAISDAGA